MNVMNLCFRYARSLIGSIVAVSLLAPSAPLRAESIPFQQAQPGWSGHFELRSTTFKNGSTLPQSMILNAAAVFGISPVVGCEGGNESPELSWVNAPRETRSFVIVMFDADASFFHWGIYNIPARQMSLPEGAGIAKSSYGQQVFNDFGIQNYDGPCPPSSFPHHYVFTIYAIDSMGTLNAPPQLFPKYLNLPTGETLFDALLQGRYHILASASLYALYGLPSGASQNAALQRRLR